MEIVEQTEKYPVGLKTAEEMAAALKYGIEPDRLVELADSRHIPHVRIDNGPPLFRVTMVKDWLVKNMMEECPGAKMKVNVIAPLPVAVDTPPPALRDIDDLKQLPLEGTEPCVYFLCDGDEVVYVGQSVAVAGRIKSHQSGYPKKKFDNVFALSVPRSELDQIEAKFILALEPKYNGRHKNGNMVVPAMSVEAKVAISQQVSEQSNG